MDFRRPLQALIPGARGRVLAALAEVSGGLSVRTVARVAGVSPAQASRVLADLVRLGLVERQEAPPSALFTLVREHVASRAMLGVARAHEVILDDLRLSSAALAPAPTSVVVFGSFARGEADSESDLDVLVVRPESVQPDDASWVSALYEWERHAGRLTGNRVEVLEVGEAELASLLGSERPLWSGIRREGITIGGRSLADLEHARLDA